MSKYIMLKPKRRYVNLDVGIQNVIELRGITKSFPGVKALKGVSFDIRPGEVHALCGENGAGKSTLMKVLTGVHKRDDGQILFEGQEVDIQSTQQTIALGIACIYQELAIVPQLDLAKNIYLGNLPQKKDGFVDKKKLYADTKEILKQVNLNVSPKTIAGELSVAQQQMVEIGRALTRNAKIIIMDEPTSSLSDKESEVLFTLIKTLTSRGVAVVYISHKLDEVMSISNRITIIRDGENITTVNTCDTTREQLISYMIGRSLENMYNKKKSEIGEVVLEVNNLTSPGVFKDISFDVKAGEVLGFFGLVGAGRSEIMRALFGVDKFESGQISINGQKVSITNPRKAIAAGLGFVPEDRKLEGLALKLSILTNMTMVKISQISRAGVINRKERGKLADEYVKSISIRTPSVKQLVGNLSGGNQQKVVIAKWLMMKPKLLILDEPTRGVDVGSKSEIYGLISELANQGIAVIVVSSELPEILGICDRVITIHEGRKTADCLVENTDSHQLLRCALGGGHK